jgi:hypothetical protein
MNKWRIILICLLAKSSLGYEQTINLDLNGLIDIWTTYEKTFNDITTEYTFAISGPNVEKIGEGDLRWIEPQTIIWFAEKPFDQKYKILRFKRLEDSRKRVFDLCQWEAYNSRVYMEYQMNLDSESQVGLIAKEPPPHTTMNYTPLGFTIFHQCLGWEGQSLLDILKKNDPNLVISLDPAVTKVNDFDSIELTCSREWISRKMIKLMSVYFSLDHEYSVVRISYYNAGGIVFEYNVRKFRSLGDGLWFPIECDIRGSQGDINEIRVTDVQINQAFYENEFELEFPPGTKVKDTITGKKYTIKPTQEQVDQVLEGQ